MNQRTTATLLCVLFVLINTGLLLQGKQTNGWLWLGAGLAFMVALD